MNKLNLLSKMGFKISWKLINMGLYGYDEIPVSLTRNDILNYLDSLLVDINEQTDNIIALICEKDDFMNFDRLLIEFASSDNSDISIQKRKWRACLLKILIDNISKDYLQGLLSLMEFWILMGNPIDCPQTFPSDDNKSIQNYFTQTSYNFMIDKNRTWLNDEILSIIKSESKNGQGTTLCPDVILL